MILTPRLPTLAGCYYKAVMAFVYIHKYVFVMIVHTYIMYLHFELVHTSNVVVTCEIPQ